MPTLAISLKISYSNLYLWSPLDYLRELKVLYMLTFPDSNSIKKTFLDKFPPTRQGVYILGLHPHNKAAMLEVKTVEFFLKGFT